MRKTIIAMCFALALTGCATSNRPVAPKIEIQRVEIPVFKCPNNHTDIDRPARPQLIIHTLSPTDKKDPGKVVSSYKIDMAQMMQYAEGLEAGFDAYRGICALPAIKDHAL